MSDELRTEIEALAERGADALERSRIPRHRRDAFARAVPWLVVVPGLSLVLQALRIAGSNGPLPIDASEFVGATLGLFGLVWFWNAVVARPPRPGRKTGLVVADRALDAEDRLTAADEFLRRAERSPFEEAAVRDAARFVAARAGSPVERPAAAPHRFGLGLFGWTLGSAGLLAFAVWCNGLPSRSSVDALKAASSTVRLAPAVAAPRSRDATSPPPPPPAESTTSPEPQSRSASERAAGDDPVAHEAGELTRRAKESRGKSGAGESAAARTISGDSDSRGVPSSRAQAPKQSPKDPASTKPLPRKERPPGDEAPPAKEAPKDESGATAGRGAAKGSNKNPAATDWSSKDQVTTPDDEDLPDDEEVEDESDPDEARGGVQPNLRDRRPPVSRDLRIGFGNAKSPDANGRGGPSQQKKSRGTASLVLGVPIPDRVKGQPNPGRTKVTQERVEPRREEAGVATAEPRAARSAPIGPVGRDEMPAWLRRLLKNYYLELRAAERGEP